MKVTIGRGNSRNTFEIATGNGNTKEANETNAKTISTYLGLK